MDNVIQLRSFQTKIEKPIQDRLKSAGKVLHYPIRYPTIDEQWLSGPPPMGVGTYDPLVPFGIDDE